MKCILRALEENRRTPRQGWWGFEEGGHRYLMRYHHRLAVFALDPKAVLYAAYETRTDRRGVEWAINHFMSDDNRSGKLKKI